MSPHRNGSEHYKCYPLAEARLRPPRRQPYSHQTDALDRLHGWYGSAGPGPRGGLLVIPTGGGKTFTAAHFLCRHPLTDGCKVLWLAHTHHLLEQAAGTFDDLAGLVAAPKRLLTTRVVSGTTGHFKVAHIKADDDVVIGTLQTMANAAKNEHDALNGFLASAAGKLVVVFDEAHHAPAASYRRLLLGIREQYPRAYFLGLTATPTHSQASKRGWFDRLFPHGILYQTTVPELIAAGVLSRPITVEAPTRYEAAFDEDAYAGWVGTNRDLPEDVIERLATDRGRNDAIADHYLARRDEYGKTLVFADRWEQCVYIAERLRARGVRADAVFSHVDATAATVEGRRRRTASENAAVLERFKANELDVLLNIRMLTEGTDVPDVQSVFLTRQTTSQILLTQMVGRGLRGPKCGGTDTTFIVSFIDDWKQRINWAGFEQIAPGEADATVHQAGPRPPVHLIGIDLVRRLARQMDSGVNVNTGPYTSFLPAGWYQVEYDAQVVGTEDVEPVRRLVMVFDPEKLAFERFVHALQTADVSEFEDPGVSPADVATRVEGWQRKYFDGVEDRLGGGLLEDVFALARHAAQNDGEPPRFFPFEARSGHDLDAVARDHFDRNLGVRDVGPAVRAEYDRPDRFWKAIYHTYDRFKSHYDGCVNRQVMGAEAPAGPTYTTPEAVPIAEPTEAVKEAVKRRDGNRCLCCGSTRRLQVDHLKSVYLGGGDEMANLQTLCKSCNHHKGTETISFRINRTPLAAPPAFQLLGVPDGADARSPEAWERCLRRSVNLFYRCAAVCLVDIGQKGPRFREWRVMLYPGNDPTWLDPQKDAIVDTSRTARVEAGYEPAPDRITIE